MDFMLNYLKSFFRNIWFDLKRALLFDRRFIVILK